METPSQYVVCAAGSENPEGRAGGCAVPYLVSDTEIQLFDITGPSPVLLREYVGQKTAARLSGAELHAIKPKIWDPFEAVWAHDVYHGDVAWRNIVITDQSQPVLIDFG